MKKNFLKKLSFVLALAMIVSLVAPAAGVFAASSPVLNASSKTLLLGTADRNDFDFNIKNKVSGSSYAWASDNEAVATVDETGLATAKSVGTTKVTVVITKKDGTDVTLSATVVVKDNIKEFASIYMQTKDAPALDKLAANTDYDFGRTFTTVSGSTTKTTSVTRWFVNSDKATIDKNGVFKATDAGTYTITAVAFQSTAKYDAWAALKDVTSTVNVLATKTLEVKVVNSFAVSQLSATTAKITFNSPMESVSKDDVTVSSLVAATSTKIKQTVKSLTLATDKKSATVELFTTFAAGTTYVVDYKDMEAQQFVGATAKAEDVVKMVITTTTMTADSTAHKIEVQLLNKDGVDLASIDQNLLNRVTFASSSIKVYASGNTLTFFAANDSTDVTAVYHTYTYDTTTGAETNAITEKITITGIATAANAVSSISAWTITNGTPDYAKVSSVLAAEDSGYKMYVKAVKADGTTFVSSSDSLATLGTQAFKFESSDKTTLIVGSDGTLYPVKTGTTNVIVSYTANGTDWTVIGAPTVNVTAKRVATTIKLGSQAFSLSNTIQFVDSKDVSIEVLDQYGVKMTNTNVSVSENVNNYGGQDPINTSVVAANATSLTFVGSVGATPVVAGTYYYTVKANGLTNGVSVTVNAPTANTTTAASYKLSVGTSYDAKIVDGTTKVTADIVVIGYASNGVAFEKIPYASLSGAGLTIKAYIPDGSEKAAILANGTGANAYTVTLADGTVSGAAVQLATGNYSFRLFKGNQYLDSQSFVLNNTQVAPTITVNKPVADAGKTTLISAVQNCVTVKDKDNKDVTTSITIGDYIGSANPQAGDSVYVKTVKYVENYGSSFVEFTINVNSMITIGK